MKKKPTSKSWAYKKKPFAGIYVIQFKQLNHLYYYVGKSKDIFQRWHQHLEGLFFKTHHNKNLQELFLAGNYRDITFSILKICSVKEIDIYEKDFINQYLLEHGEYLLNISLPSQE